MIFRFLSIVFLKWVANLLAVVVLLRFVIPGGWHGFLKAGPIWIASFVIAFLFAEWAFQKQLPSKRDLIRLIVVWVVVSYSLDIIGSVMVFDTPRVAMYGTDLHVTMLFEIAAILAAAYVTRRRKIEKTLGEGMEV